MKKISIIVAVIGGILACLWAGWYPAALVDGSPVWAKQWRLLEAAVLRSAEMDSGEGMAVLGEAEKEEIAKNTLAILIEDRILAQSENAHFPGLEEKSKRRVDDAIRGASGLERSVYMLYGLGMEDFVELVLLPQARRETAAEELSRRYIEFDEWLAEEKRQKRVRLILVPYEWDGERIK